jgi:transcriptional regulator GlxA family with amidase domain
MAAPPRTVVILVYEGVQLLDVGGPVEVFAAAGDRYAVSVASADGGIVRTSAGVRIAADMAFADVPRRIDTLIVPGAATALEHAADSDLVRVVAETAGRSRRVASVCAGAFLLAAAGLLDGRRAATHWELATELAARYPGIRVDADAIFVADGGVYTSAGITTGIDLCLALVEADHGAQVARDVARHLVVFMQRPGGQAQFSVRLRVGADGPLRGVLDAIAADPAADLSLATLSELAGFSARHLTRVFDRHVGMTPGRYVEHVRVEAAKARLQDGDEPLEVTARAVGFGSAETLRRAFARELGTTPAGYGRRFRTTARAGASAPQ